MTFYFNAPERLPFDKNLSTMKATTTRGATLTSAAADRLHHGVIDEFRATIATGRSCTSVNVSLVSRRLGVSRTTIYKHLSSE